MKKIKFLLFILGLTIFTHSANATTGGPTYIKNIQTGNTNIEIIYEVKNLGGRGCPPEIYRFNLNTNKQDILISCNDEDADTNATNYARKLENIFSMYPNILERINLNSNNIDASFSNADKTKFDIDKGNPGNTNFTLDIFQDNDRKATVNFKGCNPDQKHIIEGYRVPNSRNIVIVVSSTGDCWEGGYIYERLFVVRDINIYDITPLPIQGERPAISDIGNITIWADIKAEKNISKEDSNSIKSEVVNKIDNKEIESKNVGSTSDSPNSLYYNIIIILLILIILIEAIKKNK